MTVKENKEKKNLNIFSDQTMAHGNYRLSNMSDTFSKGSGSDNGLLFAWSLPFSLVSLRWSTATIIIPDGESCIFWGVTYRKIGSWDWC